MLLPEKQGKRQHPMAIIGYTSRNFWLLLIPLIRGLVAFSFDFYRWAEGAGWDILAVTVMFGAAVWRWYFTRFLFKDDGIYIDTGFAVRRVRRIPPEYVSAVTSETDPILSRTNAVKLYIDTDAKAGRKKDPDAKLTVTKQDRAALFNLLAETAGRTPPVGSVVRSKGFNYAYRVSKRTLVVFSFLFSSALSGTLLLGTFFTQSGKIIGDTLENQLMAAVIDVTDTVARLVKGIPPTGITISLIIGAGFLISFAANLLRHINFTVERHGGFIIITSGLFVKRMYFITGNHINYADMRQNLLMKLFGVTSVHISCTGYGKQKNELPVFVPICGLKSLYGKQSGDRPANVMEMLLPGFHLSEGFISPAISYIGRFIGPPALLVFAVILLGFTAAVFFHEWYRLIFFLTVLAEIPSVWLLFVKAGSYCTNGMNIVKGNVCIKYCTGYQFHTVTVPLERVSQIAVARTPFQRMNRSCDVIVYTNSEYTGSHRVRGLPIDEVEELLRERFGY
ncbi:MAG: PH domain-containing protein [Huintestinicola sp.]